MPRRRLEVADDLAAGAGTGGSGNRGVDGVADEADGAVTEEEVGAAGVPAAEAGDVGLLVGVADVPLGVVHLDAGRAERLVHAELAVDAVGAELPDGLAAA